jgi:hypothetical protein
MNDIFYNSITHGRLTEQEMFDIISNTLSTYPDEDFVVTIGTDSQTYSRTRVITVIAIHRVGKGGFFFYTAEHLKPIDNLRIKVYNETYRSIETAKRLNEHLFNKGLDYDIIVHLDIGRSKKGKTAELIAELMGWVKGEGFESEIKPNSYAASCIADRLSK